ncbi:hypothetical protein D3C71_1822960 [compost metagenome]
MYIEVNRLGLANLYPVWRRIAAKQAKGIIFSIVGIASIATNSHIPCMIADCLVFPPALTFADERTITDVKGRPPRSPLVMLPIPCATSSRLVGVFLL